jgi:hypothetical protein
MEGEDALRALLLTKEEHTVASFNAVCGELGIQTQPGPTGANAQACFEEQKYAAIIVDFDSAEAVEKHLPALRQSRLNRNSVVVAVATNAKNLEKALHCRAHFVLRRPLEDMEVRRTLRAAYDVMLADRRRQFRCSIVLPVRLRMVRSGAAFECSTVNVSSNGVAIYGSMPMKAAETVDLELVLPDGFVVLATGLVVWDDGHGKSGINFQCRTPEIRQALDAWLMLQAASVSRSALIYTDIADILPPSEARGAEANGD